MKRIIFAICTILCANVLFAQTRFWVDSLQYEVTSTNPAKVKVYNANESITIANIPAIVTYQGITYDVTTIGDWAFAGCSSLTSVTISNSVTSIGGYAFYGCSSLTSVTIPNSVTSIGGYAFSYCSSLTSVTIPNSVTSIGDGAFADCSSLTSVTIPNSVTSIGNEAFRSCSSLTSVTIPNSVTSIGWGAFQYCSSLTSVTIPNSVTSIRNYTFNGCSSLTSVTIPNSVTSIGDHTFSGCSSLTSIDIPNSVTSIGSNAFEGCSSLTSVTIPNSVTSIRNYTFNGCSSLTSVTIPNSVTSIGDYTFSGCSSLTSVTIPNSVTSIGNYTFHHCDSLTSVTIPNSVTSIGNSTFCYCSNLTSVTIPNSVTYIGNSTFYGCSSLTSVTIGNSVTSIRNYTFQNCSSLTSVTIPNSVTSIRDWAFEGCSSLTSVTCLANTPPSLGSYVFLSTPSNKVLYVSCGSVEVYSSNSSWASYFSSGIFELNSEVEISLNNSDFGSVAVESNCVEATLTATANEGFAFLSWNDGNTDNPRIVSLSSDTAFTAYFGNTLIIDTICQGSTYEENNFNETEQGFYTQITTDANGQDSVTVLSLTINPIYNTELTATICEGQVYTENNFNVSEAGVYTQTLTSANGCDSIVSLTLNVNPIFNTELSANICQGQVYNENGFNVSEAGVYTQTLTSVNGCDSIVTLTLTVNPIYNTELTATICEGQAYTENNFNVSEAGVYTQNLTSVNGCDSVVTLTVSVNPTFDTTINATINSGETYAEFGFNESESGTYVQNLQTENGCDSTITLNLTVNSSLYDVAELVEITFYPNPTSGKVTFSKEIEKIEVIDNIGKVVMRFFDTNEINIEALPAGAYYLRMTIEDKTIMRKVIKE